MEHLHDHEEIRFILDGVGYEDVRDFDGSWIRIEIKKGDLIVLPPGMYHRFTLDEDQYLKVSQCTHCHVSGVQSSIMISNIDQAMQRLV
ncbi:hypothetical protein KC19_4G009800 [Ceratodon purpureus]|uniref:1,2-dihydroxy-3-keto-5-methylthiopentene dioxygenase n=1 Tax=Ceratodon purpureus TaxID=3225 RepID=A0A8T0I6X1_CERPU|nr:hypothetical protein KC19_4G009800 [Ceratodon purpureus]